MCNEKQTHKNFKYYTNDITQNDFSKNKMNLRRAQNN